MTTADPFGGIPNASDDEYAGTSLETVQQRQRGKDGAVPMTPKPPTPEGISALLGKAGFAAAGRYRDDEGYRATWADGSLMSVCVRFHAAGDGSSRGLLALPALVLTAYGYSTEIVGTRLIVTAGKD